MDTLTVTLPVNLPELHAEDLKVFAFLHHVGKRQLPQRLSVLADEIGISPQTLMGQALPSCVCMVISSLTIPSMSSNFSTAPTRSPSGYSRIRLSLKKLPCSMPGTSTLSMLVRICAMWRCRGLAKRR